MTNLRNVLFLIVDLTRCVSRGILHPAGFFHPRWNMDAGLMDRFRDTMSGRRHPQVLGGPKRNSPR